ncbi:hypothetical protein EDC04DRAFT_2898402 [Pisolithus marmoratus]|nr:hypothetical protein EDC04DRAFT_2898402 [Pisolithus marmoratus]
MSYLPQHRNQDAVMSTSTSVMSSKCHHRHSSSTSSGSTPLHRNQQHVQWFHPTFSPPNHDQIKEALQSGGTCEFNLKTVFQQKIIQVDFYAILTRNINDLVAKKAAFDFRDADLSSGNIWLDVSANALVRELGCLSTIALSSNDHTLMIGPPQPDPHLPVMLCKTSVTYSIAKPTLCTGQGTATFEVPRLRFVDAGLLFAYSDVPLATATAGPVRPRGMVSVAYLVKEFIPALSAPCFLMDMKAEEITDFLAFTQHVQYTKTGGQVYISDYQGNGSLLTDPQILTHLDVGEGQKLFSEGNIENGALTAFMQEDLTDEQLQAACNIVDKWNGPEGPTPEVQAQNVQKYAVKYMHNFAEEMWRYCGMRMVCLMGWKSDNGTIQACSMDFNSDIGGGSSFDNIHALDASWRDYLGVTYENLDVAGAAEVENIPADRPRGKKGDVVEHVTNEDGQIWIGDLKGSIKAYQYYEGWACGRCSATVPFKKLGQYQADMIAPRHLPENFTFTVDPSHMQMSAAMELLTFWCAWQASHPEDVFAFQKWLDQSGELNSPSDRRALPLNIARNRNQKLQECPISTEETMDDEDGDEETEAEDTHIKSPTHHACKGLSKAHTCPCKKTPKSASWNDTTENEDREEDAGLKATHSKLPVPHNVRVPSHP